MFDLSGLRLGTTLLEKIDVALHLVNEYRKLHYLFLIHRVLIIPQVVFDFIDRFYLACVLLIRFALTNFALMLPGLTSTHMPQRNVMKSFQRIHAAHHTIHWSHCTSKGMVDVLGLEMGVRGRIQKTLFERVNFLQELLEELVRLPEVVLVILVLHELSELFEVYHVLL